jgi:hypothetical protein
MQAMGVDDTRGVHVAHWLCDLLHEVSRLTEAAELAGLAVACGRRLAASDPGNAGWQRDLSVSHNKLGDVQSAQGDLTAALASYRASLDIRARLAASDPGNAGWQRDLWVSYWRMATVAERSQRDAGRPWWQKAYEVLDAMKRRGLFVSSQDESFLAQIKTKLGM